MLSLTWKQEAEQPLFITNHKLSNQDSLMLLSTHNCIWNPPCLPCSTALLVTEDNPCTASSSMSVHTWTGSCCSLFTGMKCLCEIWAVPSPHCSGQLGLSEHRGGTRPGRSCTNRIIALCPWLTAGDTLKSNGNEEDIRKMKLTENPNPLLVISVPRIHIQKSSFDDVNTCNENLIWTLIGLKQH